MPEPLRLEVDPDICMGMGYCARTAPALFELDDDGVVRLVGADPVGPVDVPEEHRSAAGEATGLCPSGAIMLNR
jgi:ferredoxin